MNILLLLMKEWKLSLVGVLLIALLGMYGMYSWQVNKVEDLIKEKQALELSLAKVKAEYKELETSVANQNKAITELNITLKNKQRIIDDLKVQLDKERTGHTGRINNFATSTIVTKPVTTNCVNNKITRNDGSEEVNKQWTNLFQKF